MTVATMPEPAAAAAARMALNRAARASLRSVRLVVWAMASPWLVLPPQVGGYRQGWLGRGAPVWIGGRCGSKALESQVSRDARSARGGHRADACKAESSW